jgi:nucleoside-diphosphate-sugar epimerase
VIVGSGLMARSLGPLFAGDKRVVVYAAGVSNSSCNDEREFRRERERLGEVLDSLAANTTIVYLSTCSIYDPAARGNLYVAHKLAMEEWLRNRPRHLIFRLPQVAGITPNPHTLLNYLHARISRSERFQVWGNASRNVVDADDVAAIARSIVDRGICGQTINIAAPRSHSILEIVTAMEGAIGKSAVFDLVDDGASYRIDVPAVTDIQRSVPHVFAENYLSDVLRKYYGGNPLRKAGVVAFA